MPEMLLQQTKVEIQYIVKLVFFSRSEKILSDMRRHSLFYKTGVIVS